MVDVVVFDVVVGYQLWIEQVVVVEDYWMFQCCFDVFEIGVVESFLFGDDGQCIGILQGIYW